MKLLRLLLALPALALLCSCSRLSKEAKEMVGDYYIDAVSPALPIYELKSDGSCVTRAISPSLTITAPGKWNVLNDSLIIELDTEAITLDGDPSLLGTVQPRIAKKVEGFTGYTMTLLDANGIPYEYTRRGQAK